MVIFVLYIPTYTILHTQTLIYRLLNRIPCCYYRHVITQDDSDRDVVMERARQALMRMGAHDRHSPDGDILALLLGQDQSPDMRITDEMVYTIDIDFVLFCL